MSDFDSNYDDEYDDQPQEPQHVRDLRKQLKEANKRAKEADELREKVTLMERRSALSAAGLSINDRQFKALQAAHEGDWTPDAVKATAVDLGWIKEEPAETVPAEEVDFHRRQLGATGVPAGNPDLHAEIAGTKNLDELMALMQARGYPTALDGQ